MTGEAAKAKFGHVPLDEGPTAPSSDQREQEVASLEAGPSFSHALTMSLSGCLAAVLLSTFSREYYRLGCVLSVSSWSVSVSDCSSGSPSG